MVRTSVLFILLITRYDHVTEFHLRREESLLVREMNPVLQVATLTM